jgi:hypothetical protein
MVGGASAPSQLSFHPWFVPRTLAPESECRENSMPSELSRHPDHRKVVPVTAERVEFRRCTSIHTALLITTRTRILMRARG